MDPRSDEELVAAANAGDAGAFEALYERYRGWVVGVAGRYCRGEEAQDALQETFAYLLEKFPGFELRAKMTTFLFPVVRHVAIRIREKGRRFEAELDAIATPVGAETSPGADLEAVRAAVLALPEGQREVVLLRFVDGFSLEEIAAALGIPLGTVKSRLHHALRRLEADPRLRGEPEGRAPS